MLEPPNPILSLALDDVCRVLKLQDDSPAKEVIATRIIDLAKRGERSPTRLRDRVLREAGLAEYALDTYPSPPASHTAQTQSVGRRPQRRALVAGSWSGVGPAPASPIAARSTCSSAAPASAPTRARSPSPRRPRQHPASTPRRSRSAQGGNQRASAARRR